MPQDIQEFRRKRLADAAEKAGGKAALGRLLGYLDGSYVGQMLRGERPVKEDTVMKLEARQEFRGWFRNEPAPPLEEQKGLPAVHAEMFGMLSPEAQRDVHAYLVSLIAGADPDLVRKHLKRKL